MAAIKAAPSGSARRCRSSTRIWPGGAFVAGDALTMGDIPVGCVCWRYSSLDIARPELPHLTAYRARLQARAALPRRT